MKKIISLILAFAVIFNGFIAVIPAFATDDEISIEEFSAQLSDLNQMYGIDSIGGISEDTDLSEIPLNRIIVQTSDNNQLEDCGAIAKVEGYDGIHIMQYLSQEAAEQAYEYYNGLSNVEYVDFDFCYHVSEPETEYIEYTYDKSYLSWGSEKIKTNEAVSYANYLAEDAPEVVVAVIDTGIDADHDFFEGRLIDSGADLIENDGVPDDDNSHGTHVAGIIVDNTAENVKVSGYKALDSDGCGYYSTTCVAIGLAVGDDVDVINMSLKWNRTLSCYNMFEKSIQNAVGNGISVVVSAGNDGANAADSCPASNSDVITVASVTTGNIPSTFSNYGDCVDISAPGSAIKSTIPNNLYEQKSGTSMAAPYVAAAAAFLKTLDPQYTSDEIEKIITSTAYVPENWNDSYGSGILDFSKIVSEYISVQPKITLDENNKGVITSDSENAVIYYTTDGSKPVAGVSALYKEPIDITQAVSIKAIACEDGKFPSVASTLKINWTVDVTIRYKGTESMQLPPNREIESCYSNKEKVVTVDESDRTIYGASVGEAKVTVLLETGQKVTYNVTVEYAGWQKFIIYFLFGFLWYI